MTELGAIRDAYLTLVDCHTVTAELLRKSRKGPTFHGTVFLNQPLDETKRLLSQAKAELDDWAIVGLVSTFERILFKHERSPLRSKPLRKGAEGLHDAVKPFEKRVKSPVYKDVERLCYYRDWVACPWKALGETRTRRSRECLSAAGGLPDSSRAGDEGARNLLITAAPASIERFVLTKPRSLRASAWFEHQEKLRVPWSLGLSMPCAPSTA